MSKLVLIFTLVITTTCFLGCARKDPLFNGPSNIVFCAHFNNNSDHLLKIANKEIIVGKSSLKDVLEKLSNPQAQFITNDNKEKLLVFFTSIIRTDKAIGISLKSDKSVNIEKHIFVKINAKTNIVTELVITGTSRVNRKQNDQQWAEALRKLSNDEIYDSPIYTIKQAYQKSWYDLAKAKGISVDDLTKKEKYTKYKGFTRTNNLIPILIAYEFGDNYSNSLNLIEQKCDIAASDLSVQNRKIDSMPKTIDTFLLLNQVL